MKHLKTHTFVFDKDIGEELSLITKVYDNGDGELFTNQELSLQAECSSASLNLFSIEITPEILRKLADELDETISNCRTTDK